MNCLYNLLFTCRIVFVSVSPILGIHNLKFKQNIIMDETFVLKGLTLLLPTRLYNLKSFLITILEKNSNMFVSELNCRSDINPGICAF